MKSPRRRWKILGVSVLVLALLAAGAWWFIPWRPTLTEEAPDKPEAPPDLAKHREAYLAGVQALRRDDPAAAIRSLEGISFGPRAVEAYRLFHLANAYEETNDLGKARVALAHLAARPGPRPVVASAAFDRLAAAYERSGDWLESGVAARGAAEHAKPAEAGAARWRAAQVAFRRGDLATLVEMTRRNVVDSPRAPETADALAAIRSLHSLPAAAPIPLTPDERLQRAIHLLRDGDATSALKELSALESAAPPHLRDEVALQRGLALHRLRKFEDSSKALEPLTSGAFKIAVPALHTAAKNYRVLSDSINPKVIKTITVRQKVGETKVRVGKGKKKKTVRRPNYKNVRKNIELVDLAKKAKKEEYARLASERLKDLVQLGDQAASVRLEALNTLAAIAVAKNQDDYAQELVREIVKLDRWADPALQHLWDKAWAAYSRADLRTARALFKFISGTYANPNVRRQAEYWEARVIDRQGFPAEAREIYSRLASAPYQDLYALLAGSRGGQAKPHEPRAPAADWSEMAEREMPQELRLAYELTVLTDFQSALPEIRGNAKRENARFADALMTERLRADGNLVEMYRTLRRAFPLLATVEQDAVPRYFVDIYYPHKYSEAIEKNAARHQLDPNLVRALILQESYFNPKARSQVGAMGLMQIMPATGNELGRRAYGSFNVQRLDDPETNVEIGTMHLRRVLNIFSGNTQLATAAYNAGQGNVLKWRRAAPSKPLDEFLESIPFSETRNYVKRVTLLRSSYERIGSAPSK